MSRPVALGLCSTPYPPRDLDPQEAREWNLGQGAVLVAGAAARGAEVLFHPTVYGMYGETGWEAVLRARAIDNCVYVCPVNHGTREDEPWMPGMSLGRTGIVGPDGLTLAETGRQAGTVVAEIDLARPRLVRSFGVEGQADFRHELWRHRRPETYAALATRGVYLEETGTAPAVAPIATAAPATSATAAPPAAEPQPAGLSSAR